MKENEQRTHSDVDHPTYWKGRSREIANCSRLFVLLFPSFSAISRPKSRPCFALPCSVCSRGSRWSHTRRNESGGMQKALIKCRCIVANSVVFRRRRRRHLCSCVVRPSVHRIRVILAVFLRPRARSAAVWAARIHFHWKSKHFSWPGIYSRPPFGDIFLGSIA